MSTAAEAWVVELPHDHAEWPALPSAADRVWQTTLTAERGVTALLLPMTALPDLVSMHPQVTELCGSMTKCIAQKMSRSWLTASFGHRPR